jgi:hypothetical protein
MRNFAIFLLSLFTITKAVNIDHCQGQWPVSFNKDLDHISLHYDFAPDADDLMSTVADRSFLETIYGTEFLLEHTSRVGGTYGNNPGSYYPSSIPIMNKVWGDVGGALVAKGGSSSPEVVNGELEFYKNTILRGGRVFVKEGGQSDFTVQVVKELEKWNKGSGKCVYVTQHSNNNEAKSGSGVLSYVKANTVYQKISDGNTALRKTKWRLNGQDFSFYTKKSKQACAWDIIFAEFKKQKSYCPGVSGKVDQSVCVDFSDSHELFWNLQYDTPSHTININEFIQKYLLPVPESEKIKCDNVPITTTIPIVTTTQPLTTSPITTGIIVTTTPTIVTTIPTTVSSTPFKFILKIPRTLNNPIMLYTKEQFNVQYITNKDRSYTFILKNSLGKIIVSHVEQVKPYYLYGDSKGVISYGSITIPDEYTISIKETSEEIKFSIIDFAI